MQLRPYQQEDRGRVAELFRRGVRRILYRAPTGSGKTVFSSDLIRGARDKGNHVLFLAHRRELILQTVDKLSHFGIHASTIMAGYRPSMMNPVQVASIATLHIRALKRESLELPPAELIVLDECHRSLSKTYQDILAAYPNAIVLGLTATPTRTDGRGLGHVYQAMVEAPSERELQKLGFLVPCRHFVEAVPDLSGVKMRGLDYDPEALAKVMDQAGLVGDVVETWFKHAKVRQTVVFASSVAHSIHLAERFRQCGIVAEHIDAETSWGDRARILDGMQNGNVQVLCNFGICVEGWDCPPVSCVVVACPTKSLIKWRQMAGRAMRPCEEVGKTDCLILDHSNGVREHGFVDADIPWNLDVHGRLHERIKEKRRKEPRDIVCPDCHFTFAGKKACPECGYVFHRVGEDVHVRPGELNELRGKDKPKAPTREEKRRWYQMYLFICRENGKTYGQAFYAYQEKFKEKPGKGWDLLDPIPPTPDIRSYYLSRKIRWAKSKRNAA